MVTWAAYKTSLRDSAIPVQTLSDAVLADCFKWALNDLCAHTAYIADQVIDSSTVNPDTDEVYDLESDVSFKLEYNPYPTIYEMKGTAAVTVNDVLLEPGEYGISYDGYVVLKNAPIGTVRIVYYAYYPYPIQNTDVLAIPQWAESIIKYRVISHALIPLAIEAAEIGQYDGPRDKGSPEDNPLQRVQEWSEHMYKIMLEKVADQNRKPLWQ